jgi:type IV pilus assembly protein PilF
LYTRTVRQQSAAGLLLGIQLAKVNSDTDAEASYAMALRNLYPRSAEYQSYQRAQPR